MRQILHILTQLAAKCGLKEPMDSLIMNTSIQHISYKMVQEESCIEPIKDHWTEAFKFAVAYDKEVSVHESFEGASTTREVKQEPVMNVNRKQCTR